MSSCIPSGTTHVTEEMISCEITLLRQSLKQLLSVHTDLSETTEADIIIQACDLISEAILSLKDSFLDENTAPF